MSDKGTHTLEVPTAQLHLSHTESQVERRAHFDKAALKELANSIKGTGLLQPIVVRPMPGDVRGYEVVAGERRYLAVTSLGWPKVLCSVRDLTDAEVLEVQLIENLQREGLHELAEAEAYEGLIQLGLSVEQIAAKASRSPTYVHRRLRLRTLTKASRRAFYDGKIGYTVALELAKLPIPEHQDKALKEVLDEVDRYDEPMTASAVRQHIEREFLSDLGKAPFPVGDTTLVPKAGPCGSCPKRSGAQAALFDQVKGLGHCLDLGCFNAKKARHGELVLEEARAKGQKVITGPAAKKVAPHGWHNMNGYRDLADEPWQDPKGRSVKQLLGKGYQPVILQLPSGEIRQVAPEADVKKLLPKDRSSSSSSAARAEDKKRQLELAYRAQLFKATVEASISKADEVADLRLACAAMFDRLHHDGTVRLFKVMDLEPVEKKDKYRGKVKSYPLEVFLGDAKTAADYWWRLRALAIAGDLEFYSYGKPERDDRLHLLAKRVGVNAGKILEKLQAELKAKAAAKKGKKR